MNDITNFGFVLKVCADQVKAEKSPNRYKQLLKSLISRCRKTHEMQATYISIVDFSGKPRITFDDNYEYQHYFDLGQTFANRLPSVALGVAAVGGVARLAMNCPLPQPFLDGTLAQLQPADFRSHDSPDVRLDMLFQLFDAIFWKDTCNEASRVFGNHPDWKIYYGITEKVHYLEKHLRLRTNPDGMAICELAELDGSLETQITNFLIDHMSVHAKLKGIPVFTLNERKALEQKLNSLYGLKKDRPHTVSPPIPDWGRKRLKEREVIVYRDKPFQTKVEILDHSKFKNEWIGYQKIIKSERYLPIYCRTNEEVTANHIFLESTLPKDQIIFFLRKKIYLKNGDVGLKIHIINNPRELQGLNANALLSGGRVRLTISGSAIKTGGQEMLKKWAFVFNSVSSCILLDTDLYDTLQYLNKAWESLAWHISNYEGIDVLLMYPISKESLPDIGFIRPGTLFSHDAFLLSLKEKPINVGLINLGVNIVGISQEALEKVKQRNDNLKWATARLLSEEFQFIPFISGENNDEE
ncbi:MAG: hypothetical protein GY797_20215 [Deltaproteobacteria bacterium]|nr:hypothetical protein [Deltaproteobacteria bacterium]